MKTRFFIIAAAVVGFAACKTPYKATDNPMPSTNSTSSAIDTAASMKPQVSADSTSKPFSDTSKVSSPTDTARMQPVIDTTTNKMGVDSIHLQPADSPKAGIDSSKLTTNNASATVKPTDAIETAFTKQYASASNVVWSNYDSLANVPIDMRLTGWKKMDAEDYMAKFDFNGETYYAWYDNNGKWIGSTSAMTDFTKLPAAVNTAVKNAMKTRYQGYTISQVNREFQTGSKAYEVELSKDDNTVRMLVNSTGKITQIFKYKKAAK